MAKSKKTILEQDPKQIKAQIFGLLTHGVWEIVLSSKLTGPDKPDQVTLAETDIYVRQVVLNPAETTLDGAITVLIHELLHLLVPAAVYEKKGDAFVEAKVQSLAPKVRAVFAPTEIGLLLRTVFGRVKWDE